MEIFVACEKLNFRCLCLFAAGVCFAYIYSLFSLEEFVATENTYSQDDSPEDIIPLKSLHYDDQIPLALTKRCPEPLPTTATKDDRADTFLLQQWDSALIVHLT